MAAFTTRVELIKAKEPEDYDILHKEMEKEQFTRTITSDDNVTYSLPPAEYNKGQYTKNEVLESAKRAASRTGKGYRILVTQSAGRTWHNLEKYIKK